MSGGWTGKSLRGYDNVRVNNVSTMDFNKESQFIRECFEKVATGRYSVDEVRRWVNSKGVVISKNQMLNILRNITYTGKIIVPQFKDNPETVVQGLHPPLISDELFSAVQKVLGGRKRNMKFKLDKSDLYPLKGFLKCPIHNRTLSAYGSKGRSYIYHYYVCTYPRGRCPRYPIDWTHDFIISVLGGIKSSIDNITKHRRVFESIIKNESQLRTNSITRIERELITQRHQLIHLRDEFLKRHINGDTYQELKTEVESNIYNNEVNLRDMVEEQSPLKKFLFNDVPLLGDVVTFFEQSNGVMKRNILRCIFSEKIYFDEKKDATISYTKPIETILMISNGLNLYKQKKQVDVDLFSLVAPLIEQRCNYSTLTDYVVLHRTWYQKVTP